MKYSALILLFSIVFFSCSSSESTTTYIFSEKEGEVQLSDLSGVKYSLVCSVNGKEKKCGVVFVGFSVQSAKTEYNMEYSSSTVVVSGFKDASILTIQMKDENTGKSKPLISYIQDNVPYMKGSEFVPSVMDLYARKSSSEYSYTGYFDGDKWIEHDTTVTIGDTLFANENGVLDFSLVDGKGNRARLVMNIAKFVENNDASTIESMRVDDRETSDTYTYYYWKADSASIAVEPLDVNFEFNAPNFAEGCNSIGPNYFPYVHFILRPFTDQCYFDALVFKGGVIDRDLKIEVVNYAK